MLTLRQTLAHLSINQRRILLESLKTFTYRSGYAPIRFKVYTYTDTVLILMVDTRMMFGCTHLPVEEAALQAFEKTGDYCGSKKKTDYSLYHEGGCFINSWTATLLISSRDWKEATEEVVERMLLYSELKPRAKL
jgi:hypothetical protein